MRIVEPSFRHDLDSIKDDIGVLQSDVSSALRHLASAGVDEAGELKDRLESELRDRLKQLSAKAEELTRRGRRAVEGLEGMIEDKPLHSVGIAAGVGLLIGVLVCRR